ncbi:MAG: hypothetical protein KAG28_01040 [Cocleimonas sp.]|nr:hypothetical protein [Cocleimonas sp.]
MNTPMKNLMNGFFSLVILIPLPTMINHIYNSFQSTGKIIVFNSHFQETESYFIIGMLALFMLYLLYKSLRSIGDFLLKI